MTREVDGGLETVKLKLPAIITTDLRLNEPRYPSLPNIMKAKKKPLDVKKPEDFGVDIAPRIKVLKTTEPPTRKAGIKVADVAELVSQTQDRGGSDLMAILVLAEHTNSALGGATAKAVTAAVAMSKDVHVLVAGHNCQAAADAAAKISGVSKVLVADAPHLANGLGRRSRRTHRAADEPATTALLRRLRPRAKTSCRASQPCST